MSGQQFAVPNSGRRDATRLQERSAERGAPEVREAFAGLLADVLHVDDVPLGSHFFKDLGADSLVMAHFCARVRKRPELPSVSMRDIYRHPTVEDLAIALTGASPAAEAQPKPAQIRRPAPVAAKGRPHFLLCGALQLLSFVGYAFLLAVVMARGYEWISAGGGSLDVYLRSVVFGAVVLVVQCALPVIAKWVLIGRFKAERIRVWSLPYVRFWLVKTLIRFSPLVLFVGSPLYPLYLRALGARVGRGVTILSRFAPVCTDLLSIGDGTVIRKDSMFGCYRAHDGVIETGPVSLGRGAVVSEATVVDIGSELGEESQLGHASSLHTGQSVPDGEHWHGTPAQPTSTDFLPVEPARCGSVRRALNGFFLLLTALLLYVPLAVGLVDALLSRILQGTVAVSQAETDPAHWTFYVGLVVVTAALFFGAIPVVLTLVAAVPRLLGRFVTPGRTYPLYGVHHALHRATLLITNRKSLTRLFGDSSMIVHYLRWIGYDLSRVEQTGSNFGTQVKHESPFVSRVGTGTMVADGLSLMNVDYSRTSFRLSTTSIGAHNFVGNHIAYPTRGRTGDNCLLATKVMVPVDGPVRHDVGLLGSPSFEIPRSVLRDSTFDVPAGHGGLRARLADKSRHNVVTMIWYLLTGWLYLCGLTTLYGGAASLYTHLGSVVLALANLLVLPLTVVFFVLVERAVTALHPPGPLFCSIYDRRFWRRERYWKLPSDAHLRVLDGTPFKSLVWRLLGVRIGARVFDDGCSLTERRMVTIGDGSTLNAGSVVQCHSQEDGTFKSDRSVIGSGCTLGVGSLVHYGTTLGDGAVLAADSFLMKGETVPEHARWSGNPAHPVLESGGGGT